MKYLKQICLILLFSFLGEFCRFLIPYPIPASIYGMALMFAALSLKIIRLEQVRDAGSFLSSILPVLFVAPAVSLLECWDLLREALIPLLIVTLLSTVITFAAGGILTQWLTRGKGGADRD